MIPICLQLSTMYIYTIYIVDSIYRQHQPLHVPCSGGWRTRVHCVDEGQSSFAIAAQLAGGLVIDIAI